MPRKPRVAAKARAMPSRDPSPPPALAEDDEEMIDLPASTAATPHGEGSPDNHSTRSSENVSAVSAVSTPAARHGLPQKRRLGRPPKHKPSDWETLTEAAANDVGSEGGTPFKRRRGRPSMGGGRWGKPRGGPSHVTQVPIDKEGNMLDVVDDEVVLPDDPDGEKKVDRMGHLQDGRQYRCRTFTTLGRGERLYMLSTEPARCIGFRDSYLFFQKHKLLYKIIIDDNTKRDLIDRALIPNSYKGRAIGIVTARSVFREFGAQIVVGGRKIMDDYHEAAARANGDVEGELADPNDKLPTDGEPYNQNQYVAWHGASSVYHSGAPSVPTPSGNVVESKKKKVVVNDVNWLLEHVRSCSRYNSELSAARYKTIDGVYDGDMNIRFFPRNFQPTHARWEQVDYSSGTANPSPLGPHHPPSTILPPLNSEIIERFFIIDTHFLHAPASDLGIPGPDADMYDDDVPHLDNIPKDQIALLPPDCRKAFEEKREQQREWRNQWKGEMEDGLRRPIKIDYYFPNISLHPWYSQVKEPARNATE